MKRAGPGDSGHAAAPPIVHEVLRSPGQPLDPATRSFMEPRFGHDFEGVRVHTGGLAAESARAVNALAYTVGREVVFDAGQFQPGTTDGQRLLAHELAHTIQQSPEPFLPLQRACKSGPACTAPIAGDPGQAGAKADAAQQALKEASGPHPPGTPATCQAPRHKDPATNVKALAEGAGLGVTTPPSVFGIFINACLPDSGDVNLAGQSNFCSATDSAPAGAPPKKWCVEVHPRDEDDAKSLLAKPEPLNDRDNTRKLDLVATVQHEYQHGRFEARAPSDPADRAVAGAALLPAKADCNLDTVVHSVGGDVNVQFILSEISAEIAEFDVYFKNRKKFPGSSTRLAVRSEWAMQTEEHNIATRSGENILGSLKKLQCTCDCDTVDAFTIAVFNDATGSWTPEERTEFNKAMTGFIPSFWPKALQVR